MTDDAPGTAPPSSRGDSWRRFAWIGLAILGAFIIGFAWQGIRAVRIGAQLDETRQALTLHRLEGSLAAATMEARRGSFELARQNASDFYTELQHVTGQVPPSVRNDFATLLGQRDQMITLLSRGDAEAADLLAGAYFRYRTARARAEQELPRSR